MDLVAYFIWGMRNFNSEYNSNCIENEIAKLIYSYYLYSYKKKLLLTNKVKDIVKISNNKLLCSHQDNSIEILEEKDGIWKSVKSNISDNIKIISQCFEENDVSNSIENILILKDDRILTCHETGLIGIWKEELYGYYRGKMLFDDTFCIIGSLQLQDGRIITHDVNGTIVIWKESKEHWVKKYITGHTGIVIKLIQLQDERLAGFTNNNQVIIWKNEGYGWNTKTIDNKNKIFDIMENKYGELCIEIEYKDKYGTSFISEKLNEKDIIWEYTSDENIFDVCELDDERELWICHGNITINDDMVDNIIEFEDGNFVTDSFIKLENKFLMKDTNGSVYIWY
jgi:hypothetical protein